MTDQAPETIAERLDALQARAETDIRNHVLLGIVAETLHLMRVIDATKAEAKAEPGTGITPDQLEQAIGGVTFIGQLGAMLDRIDQARREDVERVLHHLFADRPPAPTARSRLERRAE